MAAETITGSEAASAAPARSCVGETTLYGEFDIATDNAGAAFEQNDVLEIVKVPRGFQVLEVILATDDLDTSTGIVLDVGDAADVDRFIDGSTVGQAGGVARLSAPAGVGYTYTTDDTIDVLVQVAASGTAATSGTIKLTVIGRVGY